MKTQLPLAVSCAVAFLFARLAAAGSGAARCRGGASRKPRPPTRPEQEQPAAAAAKEAESPKFIRLRRDDSKRPLAMETAVVRYVAAGRPGVVVDLIGAVHIGDKSYYDELNKLFESYEVLLYELVAPEGTTIPKGGRKGGGAHPIGALQDGMGVAAGIAAPAGLHRLHQGQLRPRRHVARGIQQDDDRSRRELLPDVPADDGTGHGPECGRRQGRQQRRRPAVRPLLRATGRRSSRSRWPSNSRTWKGKCRRPEDSTIIGQRNRKCFEVLDKQLKEGKKTIGVFYGAGHFPDMEKRLAADFGLKRESEKWLTAWQLAKKQAEEQKPVEDKPAEGKKPDVDKPANVDKPAAEKKP